MAPKTNDKPQAKPAQQGNKPVHTFRLGSIKATVWANQTGEGKTFFNVTFSRGYKDDAGNWKDSDSFGRDDLPLVAKVADQAHTFIYEKQAADRKANPAQAEAGSE